MIERVLTTVGVAAAIVLLGHLLGWQPWRGEEGPSRGDWGAILGIAAAVAFSQAFLKGGMPDLPPADATAWIFWLTVAAAGVALVDVYVGKSYVVWPLRIVLVITGGYLLVEPLLQHAWSGGGGLVRIAVFSLITLGVWAMLERLVIRAPDDSTVPLGIAFSAAAAAGVIAYVSSVTIGLLAAALALGLGATTVMMWLRHDVSARGAFSVFLPLLAMVYLVAYAYADIAAGAIALFVVALLVAWLGEFLVNKRAWVRAALRVAIAVVPVAVALPMAEAGLSPTLGKPSADAEMTGDRDGPEPDDEDQTYVPY